MGKNKDFNWYTYILCAFGILGILYSVISINNSNYLLLLFIIPVITLLDIYPLKIPNGIEYTVGSTFGLLVLLKFGLPECILSVIISTLVLCWKRYGSVLRINWFRYLVSIGMHSICFGLSALTYSWSEGLPYYIQVLLAVGVSEVTTFFLINGLRSTMMEVPFFKGFLLSFNRLVLSVPLFTLILSDLQRETIVAQWVQQFLLYSILAGFIIWLSNLYFNQLQARKRVEDDYRLIAENTMDLITVVDEKGIIKYASPSYKTVLGFPEKAIVGKSLTSIKSFVSDSQITVNELLHKVIAQKEPVRFKARIQGRNHEWLDYEQIAAPVMGKYNQAKSLVLVGRDITDQEKTRELLRKSDKLSVAGQLAAGIAHEIRNPLTAIRGFIQLMKTGNTKQEYYDTILSEIDRMNSIISEFLVLARPQALAVKEVNLHELVNNTIDLVKPQAILKGIQIDYHSELENPIIRCDGNQIKQVLINIVKNAIEAIPERDGYIRVETKTEGESTIHITFSDNGDGIPEERLPHLGEPFYSTKEKGTGLGLMISNRIIEEHGGHIQIQSQINKGTDVTITLPRR